MNEIFICKWMQAWWYEKEREEAFQRGYPILMNLYLIVIYSRVNRALYWIMEIFITASYACIYPWPIPSSMKYNDHIYSLYISEICAGEDTHTQNRRTRHSCHSLWVVAAAAYSSHGYMYTCMTENWNSRASGLEYTRLSLNITRFIAASDGKWILQMARLDIYMCVYTYIGYIHTAARISHEINGETREHWQLLLHRPVPPIRVTRV